MKSSYDEQAEKFLQDTGTTFKAEFIGNRPYFEDDKEARDVYQITLTRTNRKPMTFTFGQSIANSGLTVKRNPHGRTMYDQELIPRRYANDQRKHGHMFGPSEKDRIFPTAYDVLSCLTKYDPGSFEDFCSEYGYDTDSKKAEKTFLAVLKEYHDLKRLFTEKELETMQEIQ